MKNSRLLSTLVLVFGFSISASASAQCAAGIPSGGNPQCLPPDALYKNQGITQPQSTVPAQQPIVIRQKWADRWGAISADGRIGSLGFVTGYPSKRIAEKAAVQECHRAGGKDCRAEFAFHNQCAAFIVSNEGSSIAGAPTEKEAATLAIKNCQKDFSSCRVYRTACSHAEAVPIR